MRGRLAPLGLIASLVYAASAGQSPTLTQEVLDDEGVRFRDVELLAAIVHRSLDRDCDGVVALADVAETFGLSGDEPRSGSRLASYDENGDGSATPADLAAGIRAGVEEQVELTLLVDANGDGELTLREHALGFPDHAGEKNADGFTPRQIQSFQSFDTDANSLVTREEIVAQHETTFIVIAWAQMIGHHMKRIDSDGNGIVGPEEFARGLGHSSPDGLADEEQAWYEIVAPQGRPGIALDVFRVQLLQSRPVASRLALERPIRPIFVPDCAPPAH